MYLEPKEGDATYDQQCDIILKPKNLQLQTLSITLQDKTFLHHIHENLINEYFVIAIKSNWKNPPNDFDKFEFHDGLLYHDRLLYVSEGFVRLQVFQTRHDTLITIHIGFNKTMELISCNYCSPQLCKFMKEFVRSCDVYVYAKNPCHCPHGLLKPLSVPTSTWSSIYMDFIMDLP